MTTYKSTWDLSTIPDPLLVAERNRRIATQRTTPPRAKVLVPCRYCGDLLGTVERRKHEPRCPKRRPKRPEPVP